MIRKQIYLDEESERKLKALARTRRCSEAEVIRFALRCLPEPAAGVDAALEAAGFVPWLPDRDEDVPDEDELRALHRRLASLPGAGRVRIAEAVVEDREERL